jgi:DNA-binding NarL/FixJ family response regulator
MSIGRIAADFGRNGMSEGHETGSQTGEPAATRTLKVGIIEDRREIREGLRILIDGTRGFHCVGVFASMEAAVPAIGQDLPDVALVDIGLPGVSGIDGIRLLRERHPTLLFLALTVYDDDDRIFDALCAGACGYLLKKTPPARLLESIAEAVAGGSPMSPEIARRVVTLFRDLRPTGKADYQLTPHETRLLKLLVDGHNYNTAAVQVGVSVNTVAFHMRHIYEKLQVHSKSQAVSKALRDHLFS